MTLKLEVKSPTFDKNQFVADSSNVFSNKIRLFTHSIIDQNTDEKYGMEEAKLKKAITTRFGQVKFNRDVFDPLSSNFLDKRWGYVVNPKKEQIRWVSTPIGDPLGNLIREQTDNRLKEIEALSKNFQTISHQSRVSLIRILYRKGVLSGNEITKIIFPKSSIGHHLDALKTAGIVETEPEDCNLKKNQLPDKIYAGEKIDLYNELIHQLGLAIEKIPSLDKYPLWYFMHTLKKPEITTIAIKTALPLVLATLPLGLGHTFLPFIETKKINEYIDNFKTTSSFIEKFDANDTLKDFLQKDVEIGTIMKNKKVLGFVTKNSLREGLRSMPLKLAT